METQSGSGIGRIVLVGLGGIGGLMALNLSKLSRITDLPLVLADGDDIEPHNLDRQFFQGAGNKAAAWYDYLTNMVGFNSKVDYEPSYIESGEFFGEEDIILLCVDNHATRRIVDARSRELSNITIISGGNELTDGNVQWLKKVNGEVVLGKYLTEVHPEIATCTEVPSWKEEQHCDSVKDNRQLYIANMTAASIMANVLWLILTENTDNLEREVYFDIERCKSVMR